MFSKYVNYTRAEKQLEIIKLYKKGKNIEQIYNLLSGAQSREFIKSTVKICKNRNVNLFLKETQEVVDNAIRNNDIMTRILYKCSDQLDNYLDEKRGEVSEKVIKTIISILNVAKDYKLPHIKDQKHSPNLTKIYEGILPIFKNILDIENNFILIQGGRGSGKSIGLVDIALISSFKSVNINTNFLCFRQYQVSMQASMHSLFKERINFYELQEYFKITNNTIVNIYTNVTIYFKGLVDPQSIKSINNISLAIGDEAQQLLTHTLEVLLPSIRRVDKIPSKVIMAMNPLKTQDACYTFVEKQGSNGYITTFNIFDLPIKYQNPSLLKQAEVDRQTNMELYKHKWLGEPSPVYAGTPFVNILTTDELIMPIVEHVYMYIDPAMSGVNDYTGVTIVWPGHPGTNHYRYNMVYGVVYRMNYRDVAPSIAELVKKFQVSKILYEQNGGAHSMNIDIQDELDKLGYRGYELRGVYNRIHKIVRINKLIGVISQFEFINHPENKEYLEQIKNYNPDYSRKANKEGYYDDAPDSLAGVVEHYMGL